MINAIRITQDVDYALSATMADQHSFPIGQCFANCWRFVTFNRKWCYVEGYVIDQNTLPIPIEHAWLLHPSGVIVDPTMVSWSNKNGRGPSDLVYFPAVVMSAHKMDRLAAVATDYETAYMRFPLAYFSHAGDRTRQQAASLAAHIYTVCKFSEDMGKASAGAALVLELLKQYTDAITMLDAYYPEEDDA